MYKMRRMLSCVHYWRAYVYFVKRIDPTLLGHSQEAEKMQEIVLVNEPTAKPPPYTKLSRIDEISVGLSSLNRMFKKSLRSGWEKISSFALCMQGDRDIHDYTLKYHKVQTMLKHRSNRIHPFFSRWRENTRTLARFQVLVQDKLQHLLLIIRQKELMALAKRFRRWASLVRMNRDQPEELENEEIEEEIEEEIKEGPAKSEQVVDIEMFNAEITKGGSQLTQMLRAPQNGSYPAQRVRDDAIKRKIKEICIGMMNEIISKYIAYKHNNSS